MQTGCGCVKLGSATAAASWSDHVRLVRGAVDAGVTVFDTADAYSSGISERLLGAAVQGRRGEVTIATKVGYMFRPRTRVEQQARRAATKVRPLLRNPFGGSAESAPSDRVGVAAPDSAAGQASGGYQEQDFSPEHIRRALTASLDRLGTDYIDVYQLHGPPSLLDSALGALVEARDAGLVRAIGVGAESIESAAEWSACPEIDVVQLPFGVLDPEAATSILGGDRSVMPNRRFWVRGVLGGGILAAAMRDPAEVEAHPKRRLVLDLIDIADGAGMRLDELAVRWVRNHGDVDAMLVGISSPAHLRRTVELSEMAPLPADVAAAVNLAQANTQNEAT